MANTITITPDENGKAVVRLYGADIDVTNILSKGRGTLRYAGDTYQLKLATPPKAEKARSTKRSYKQEEAEATDEI